LFIQYPIPNSQLLHLAKMTTSPTAQSRAIGKLTDLPWWLLIMLFSAVLMAFQLFTNAGYKTILDRLAQGIATTLTVTLTAYPIALLIGLIAGLGRVSKNKVVYTIATLYVQIIRGIPILVQLMFIAFVFSPMLVDAINAIGVSITPVFGADNALAAMTPPDLSFTTRAIMALAVAYGGFEAETFRAGIESLGKGQMEAARALGLSYMQAMRFVVLPQAIRRVLPPLGNDFISMLKDSSLVSVLGVGDVTNEARKYASASFKYMETYVTLAFIYLSLTLSLSLILKGVENRLNRGGRGA